MSEICPWCDGKDKNFRPLRFGRVPCNNPWHNNDAQRENEPCKKHGHWLPCPYCEIDRLTAELERYKQGVEYEGKIRPLFEFYAPPDMFFLNIIVRGDFNIGQRVRVLVMKEE